MGNVVSQADCEEAARSLLPVGKTFAVGSMVVNNYAGCAGGWGHVPHGCSVQSGSGSWAPHYNQGGSTCPHAHYQLVCKGGERKDVLGLFQRISELLADQVHHHES